MKHSYSSHSDLCHAWAHQITDYAYANNMHFQNGCIFSYNTCIGELGEIYGTPVFAYVNEAYSVSTSKHQHTMHNALPAGRVQVPVPYHKRGTQSLLPIGKEWYERAYKNHSETTPGRAHRHDIITWGGSLVEYYIKESEDCLKKAGRARKQTEAYLAQYYQWLAYAEQIKKVCKLRVHIPEPAVSATLENRIQLIKAATEKKRQRDIKKSAKAVKEWLAGTRETRRLPNLHGLILFRVINVGDALFIETTKNIKFPYEEGRKALEFVLSKKDKGWNRNGEQFKVGGWDIDSVNRQGVIAGCHRIKWEHIMKFAKQEDWV